jgi:ribose transport system ATP-binding protein
MEELLELADRLVVLNEGISSGEMLTEHASPDDVLAILASQAPEAALASASIEGTRSSE